MNLRLSLSILFSTVNTVELVNGAHGNVAEALLILWKLCGLSMHAPVGTRSALIQASGFTKTAGPSVKITKYQIDFVTLDILTGEWTQETKFEEPAFVLWDSTGVQHTIHFYPPQLESHLKDRMFDVPGTFLDTPQWRFMLFKEDHLDYIVNNGSGYRKRIHDAAITMGGSPLMDAHYSYNAPMDTVYMFNKAECMEIKSYSRYGGPLDFAKPCDPKTGGFHHRTPSIDFEKFTTLDTYPMAFVNFSSEPLWTPENPRPAGFTPYSIVTMAPGQGTTRSNITKSDIGMPVDDAFVEMDSELRETLNGNNDPGTAAVYVIAPIVALIFLCLLAVLGAFWYACQGQKKTEFGSQVDSQTSHMSMVSRLMGLGRKTSKSQSRAGQNEEGNPDVEILGPHDSDLPTEKRKTSTKCSSTPLITPMSTKKTQQTSQGNPSMVPQDSKDRRLRKYLPSGSRSPGYRDGVKGTSASKNKTASKNTKKRLTGISPSMVPQGSGARRFKKNLPSASRFL